MDMRRTGDQYLVKEINISIVLDTIIRHRSISRASISAFTGLNKSTVSSLVQELIDRQLVFETGTGESSGGRKPVLLQFRHDAGFAIGVDLGVNYIHTLMTDLDGTIINVHTTPHRNEDQQAVLDQLFTSIQTMANAAPASPYGLVGIGIGIPGIVNSNGQILFAPNLGWRKVNLIELLHEQFHVPIHVDNEANAGAIGEQQFGAGKGTSDLIFISAGIGIGSGIIMKNEIYKGASGFSGEIGHLTIDANGKPCRCGNRGCWELYASEHALLSMANEKLGKSVKHDALNLDSIVQMAEQNHPEILEALDSVGRYLGIGIAGIINTFNPTRIIIGNRLSKVAKWLIDPLLEEIKARSLSFHHKAVEIQFTDPHTHSTAMGAAYIAISSFMQEATSTPKNQN